MAAQLPGALLSVNYYIKDNGFGLRNVGTTIRTKIMFSCYFSKHHLWSQTASLHHQQYVQRIPVTE